MTAPSDAIDACNEALEDKDAPLEIFLEHWPTIRQHIEDQQKEIEVATAAWRHEVDMCQTKIDVLRAKVEEQADQIQRLEHQLTPEALTKYRSEWGDWNGYPTAYERDLAERALAAEAQVEEQQKEIKGLYALCNSVAGGLINGAHPNQMAKDLAAGVDWEAMRLDEEEVNAVVDQVEEQQAEIERLKAAPTIEELSAAVPASPIPLSDWLRIEGES